jgi:hypothetical protein
MLKKTLCLLALCAAIGLLAFAGGEQKAAGNSQQPGAPPATTAPATQPSGTQTAPTTQPVLPSTPGATPTKSPVATPMIPSTPPPFVDDDGEGGSYDPTQDPTFDPFSSAPTGTAPGAQAQAYPDEEEGAPPPDTELVPQNPVRQAYEDGKIIVLVGSERHFGYRIGDRVQPDHPGAQR